MRKTFVPLRISAVAALAVGLGGGCAATHAPTGTAVEAPGARERGAVVTCYATGYRKRSGFSPVLDEKTDAAADQLLKKHDGSAKRACDVISAALSTASCGAATTLGSLISCDPHMMRAADIDPSAKASLESRIREGGQGGPMRPSQSPVY